jgi:3-hydroxybutyryl-CoA dehydratase
VTAAGRGRQLCTFDDLHVGQSGSVSRTVSEADILLFTAVSGDNNPLHSDEEFARRTFFGGRIAHGMLTASLLSTAVGMVLPGTGAIYRSQTLEFLKPVRAGDTLTAHVTVDDLDREQNRVVMTTWIDNQRGERVLQGHAVMALVRGLRE